MTFSLLLVLKREAYNQKTMDSAIEREEAISHTTSMTEPGKQVHDVLANMERCEHAWCRSL